MLYKLIKEVPRYLSAGYYIHFYKKLDSCAFYWNERSQRAFKLEIAIEYFPLATDHLLIEHF